MKPPLVARTAPLSTEVDVLALVGEQGLVWMRPGLTLAGTGVAMTIDIPRSDPASAAEVVARALGTIQPESVTTSAPMALGALPFTPDKPGHIVVPEVLVTQTDNGSAWVTTVSPDGNTDPMTVVSNLESATQVTSPPSPGRFEIQPSRPVGEWCAALGAARSELRARQADKVVLARSIKIITDIPISRRLLLERLRTTYPSCMIYAIDGLVGASPELLVARQGGTVRSHPMAGTAPRSDDPAVDEQLAADLKTSAKDLIEHRYTIDMVHETLLPWCSWLDEEAEPSLVTMANVRHLATLVEGRLSSPPASVIELMTALHPTPAVCGSPRPRALELIERFEELDRGCYSGPVGWVDANGDGEWAVAIRCAQIEGAVVNLMAGVGIVADSDVDAELAETRAKLQALLGAIVRP